jgi:hypothetical protein
MILLIVVIINILATIDRRKGINPNLYYRSCKGFLEGSKKRLSVDIRRFIYSYPNIMDIITLQQNPKDVPDNKKVALFGKVM